MRAGFRRECNMIGMTPQTTRLGDPSAGGHASNQRLQRPTVSKIAEGQPTRRPAPAKIRPVPLAAQRLDDAQHAAHAASISPWYTPAGALSDPLLRAVGASVPMANATSVRKIRAIEHPRHDQGSGE